MRLVCCFESLGVAVDCAGQLVLKLLCGLQFLIHQLDQLIVLHDAGFRAKLQRLRFQIQDLGLIQARFFHHFQLVPTVCGLQLGLLDLRLDLRDLHRRWRGRLLRAWGAGFRENLIDVWHFHVVQYAARYSVPVEARD